MAISYIHMQFTPDDQQNKNNQYSVQSCNQIPRPHIQNTFVKVT